MNRHPYIRAYMAGVLLPSWFLLVVLTVFVAGRRAYAFSVPIEQMIIFPMAVIPNLWGLWNATYVAMVSRRRLPLGVWGALLPLILVPGGLGLERFLGFSLFTAAEALAVLPIVVGVYYLAWKHVVPFFNRVAGVE